MSGNSYPFDTLGHHTARNWQHLADHFEEVHVFARSEDNAFHEQVIGQIHLHLIPKLTTSMKSFLVSSWILPIYAVRIRPGYILAQSPLHGGLPAVLTSKILGTRSYVELHGEVYFKPELSSAMTFRCLLRPYVAQVLKLATRLRALSPAMVGEIRATYGASAAAKAVVVQHRVDLTKFKSKVDWRSVEKLRLITIGALIPVKNHLGLVRALSECPVPVELSIVGEGPLYSTLDREAQLLGVDLKLLGGRSQEEVASALLNADVYVHYSHSETGPRATLEAMASALPVVSTPVGYVASRLPEADSGFVVPHDDAAALAQAIRDLSDESTRRRMGLNGRGVVEHNFEASHVFASYAASIAGP